MKEIKYDKLYKECYKMLPHIISLIWACIFVSIAIADILDGTSLFSETYQGILQVLVGNIAHTSAIFALLLWIIIAAFGALLLFYVTAIIISQKMRVVEELEKLNKMQENNDLKPDKD